MFGAQVVALRRTGEVIREPGPLRLLLYRPFGIGMLIGGAVMGVILAAPLILSAIKSMQKAAQVKTDAAPLQMAAQRHRLLVGSGNFVRRTGTDFQRLEVFTCFLP